MNTSMITAAYTIFGGIMVFIISQFLLKLVIEPVAEYRRLLSKISYYLMYYTIARFRLEFFHGAATIIHHSRQIISNWLKTLPNRYAWQRIAIRVAMLE